MSRRASEGSGLPESEIAIFPVGKRHLDDVNVHQKSSHVPERFDLLGYNNSASCDLNFNVARRESTFSLSSCIADDSKNSFASYNSISTLTGHETDDSEIMTRFRKSVKQKEEFLNMPLSTVERSLIRREFYSEPKKLDPQVWPPNETEFSARIMKPIHHNFQKEKHYIENEKNISQQNDQSVEVGIASSEASKHVTTSPPTEINEIKDSEAKVALDTSNSVDLINNAILKDKNYEDKRYKIFDLYFTNKTAE